MKILSLAISLSWTALLTGPVVAQCSLQLNTTVHVTGTSAAVLAAVTMPNGDLVIAGRFTGVQGTSVSNIARRSGGTWLPLGGGLDNAVNSLAVMPNGDLMAGGTFNQAGGVAAAKVARWNGSSWSPLGAGLTGSQIPIFLGVRVLLVRPNGDLVAGGHFVNAGGIAANNIAAWNGTAWSPLAGGIPGGVHPSTPPPVVDGLANLPNGDLAAIGGALRVQRWNGTSWSAMNSGIAPVSWQYGPTHLFVSSAGTPFACGTERLSPLSPTTPFVKQWNGTTWTDYGVSLPSSGVPLALAELPTGDLVVGGDGLNNPTTGATNQMLRSSGAGWTSIANTRCAALSMERDGSLRIVTAGPLAELISTCPASITTVGAACTGSLGQHTLTASSLPWLGTTFRAVTDAVPATAVALAVSSLSPSTVPLSVVLPIAGFGCDGLVAADLTELLLPSGNEVTSHIVLPPSPVLVGLAVHHYVAVLEFGTNGTPIGLTSTGRLLLTLGTY